MDVGVDVVGVHDVGVGLADADGDDGVDVVRVMLVLSLVHWLKLKRL